MPGPTLRHPRRDHLAHPTPTLHPAARGQPVRRRSLLLGALSSSLLAACGDHDEAQAPATPLPGASAQQAADEGVRQGLVGLVCGQLDSRGLQLGAAGVRRLGTSAALRTGDLMALGSNTKAMTAACIARLVAQGRLAWQTTLAQALPMLADVLHPAYAPVTLAQLLDHRGGLPSWTRGDELLAFYAALQADPNPPPDTLAGRRLYVARWLLSQAPPADRVPGQTFAYSNAGYALAATLVEAVTGRGFEAWFDEQLVRPLDLAGTWAWPLQQGIDQPTGHAGLAGALQPVLPDDPEVEGWLAVLAPAGDWATRAADHATWLRWHLRALQGQATPLAADYVRRLQALPSGDYALGWVASQIDGHPVLAHNGAERGFMATVAVDLQGRRAGFAHTNTEWVDDSGGSWVLQRTNEAVVAMDERVG